MEIKCIYINSNSLTANKEEIEIMIEVEVPNIVLCAETHITENVTDSEIKIIGYNHVRCNSFSRHIGGVIMYINKSINFKIKYNKCVDNNMWCIILSLTKSKAKWLLGVCFALLTKVMQTSLGTSRIC